eukprot:1703443-Rhodomonas_salina.2
MSGTDISRRGGVDTLVLLCDARRNWRTRRKRQWSSTRKWARWARRLWRCGQIKCKSHVCRAFCTRKAVHFAEPENAFDFADAGNLYWFSGPVRCTLLSADNVLLQAEKKATEAAEAAAKAAAG